jgi:hypothetical protein
MWPPCSNPLQGPGAAQDAQPNIPNDHALLARDSDTHLQLLVVLRPRTHGPVQHQHGSLAHYPLDDISTRHMLLFIELDKVLHQKHAAKQENSKKPSTNEEGRPRRPIEQPTTPVLAPPSGTRHASCPSIKPYTCFDRHTGFNQHRPSAQRPFARLSSIPEPTTYPSTGSETSSGQLFYCSASVPTNLSTGGHIKARLYSMYLSPTYALPFTPVRAVGHA